MTDNFDIELELEENAQSVELELEEFAVIMRESGITEEQINEIIEKFSNKFQKKESEELETNDKTIVGAINELKQGIDNSKIEIIRLIS
jgi:hypothetical protein